MKPTTRRTLFLLAITLAVVAATFYGFMPKPIGVDLVTVTRGTILVTIEEEGRTRLKEKFVVLAPVSGYLARIGLKVGDHISRGQLLAQLGPPRSQPLDRRSRDEQDAAVLAAEATFKATREKEGAARADLEYIEKRRKRIKNLYQKQYVAKDQFEQVEADAKRAKSVHQAATAAADAARFDLERAKAALKDVSCLTNNRKQETIRIVAPTDGSIVRLYRESEGPVAAGAPLVEIGDVHGLEVQVEALSSDAARIKKGTRVIFKRWGGDKNLEGVVRVVEPTGFTKISSLGVEEQRVLVIADIVSPPGDWRTLGSGYRLDAIFIIRKKEGALQIPQGALFRSGKKWAVFIEEGGRARQKIVTIGDQNGLTAEVLSGLAEGEWVIAHPDDAIKDGIRIAGGR